VASAGQLSYTHHVAAAEHPGPLSRNATRDGRQYVIGQEYDHSKRTMKTLPLAQAKAKLSKLVSDVERHDERVTITRHGRPVAMVLSQTDVDGLEATIEIMSDPEFYAEVLRGKRLLESGRATLYTEEVVFGPKEAAVGRSTRRVPRAGARRGSRPSAGRQAKSPRRNRRAGGGPNPG
jgi:antitoxin YefM